MRSNELAKIAGVSVRTLRHYHSIGLIDEPPRSENGYRDYDTGHLVRLLRIKRLSSLGFSLSRIGEVLGEADANLGDSNSANANAALDELDRELAEHIERLQEQRRTIALLKQEQLDVDLPIRFGRAAKTLFTPKRLTDGERQALLITGHLYTEEETAELERVAQALEEQGLLGQIKNLQARYDALPADSTPEDIDLIVADTIELLDPVMDCFEPINWDGQESTEGWEHVEELMRRDLTPIERIAEDRIEEELRARILARQSFGDDNPEHSSSTNSRIPLDPDVTS